MPKQTSFNQVQPGTQVVVKGQTAYSHIASFIEGEELAKENARSKSMYPQTRPYCRLNIKNAQIVPQNPNDANQTYAESAVQERFYVSNSTKYPGIYCYQARSTGNRLPNVFEHTSTGCNQVILEDELAEDLDVTVIMNIYGGKPGMNNGIGIAAVVVEEPIRYFSSNSQTISTLEKMFGPVTLVKANPPVVAENVETPVTSYTPPVTPPQAPAVPTAPVQPQPPVYNVPQAPSTTGGIAPTNEILNAPGGINFPNGEELPF